jgi:cytochrome c peroxidase
MRGQQGARKAPTFVDEAWTLVPVFFWDGRAASLVDQAKGPMANPIEMGNTHPQVVATVANVAGYRALFREVYGDDRVDIDRIAEAISAYEATRLDGNSRYDRYEAGDQSALTAEEQQGREVFLGKGRCSECHVTGANFSDAAFHDLGIGWNPKAAKRVHGKLSRDGFADLGRFNVTHSDDDIGAFKTPTLRDVDKHAPYMHDGSLPTLEAVVDHYDRGGTPNPWLDLSLSTLGLTAGEETALVAFLKALDGEGYQDTPPTAFPQ